MNKKFTVSVLLLSVILIFFSGCKTSEEVTAEFRIMSTSGYSKQLTTIKNKGKDEIIKTSIHLFFAVKNNLDAPGTITSWKFKIRHNIVTILEVNQNNYSKYKLEVDGNTNLPVDEITEFYVNTPNPFDTFALTENEFIFKPYLPTEVIVELDITANDGTVYSVTAAGTYTFEQETVIQD